MYLVWLVQKRLFTTRLQIYILSQAANKTYHTTTRYHHSTSKIPSAMDLYISQAGIN